MRKLCVCFLEHSSGKALVKNSRLQCLFCHSLTMRREPSTTNFLSPVYFKNSKDITNFTGVSRINEGMKLETLSVQSIVGAQFMLKNYVNSKKDKTLIQNEWLLMVEGLLTEVFGGVFFFSFCPLKLYFKGSCQLCSFFFFL